MTFGIAVHFLTDRYAATQYNDRSQPEWPPHPARLFSALVDAWASEGGDEAERSALEWLESLDPPAINASAATSRDVRTVFVPVNDTILVGTHRDQRRAHAAWLAGNQEAALTHVNHMLAKGNEVSKFNRSDVAAARMLLPEGRNRQPRTFPVALPERPTVEFLWSADPSHEVRSALDGISSRVSRLGHSSSLVTCFLVDGLSEATWLPSLDGPVFLRVAGPGQLSQLLAAYERHQATESRLLPARSVRYRSGQATTAVPRKPARAGEWFVFARRDGPALPAVRAVDVTRALRGAILRHMGATDSPMLTGHQPDGRPSEDAHIGYLALPFVGHFHATGHILGAAIVLPTGASDDERRGLLAAIGRWLRAGGELRMGRAGAWHMSYEPHDAGLATLRPSRWSGPARRWRTALPIALDRNPGDLHSRDPDEASAAEQAACEIVAAAARRVGLPNPATVGLGFGSLSSCSMSPSEAR
jgi:CRISPR-associated protein Csb2